jgi:hypothetical protein
MSLSTSPPVQLMGRMMARVRKEMMQKSSKPVSGDGEGRR